MIIGQVTEGGQQQIREEFAQRIEEVAARVRKDPHVPTGIFCQIFVENSETIQSHTTRPGFDYIHAVGVFEVLKTNMVVTHVGIRAMHP